MQKYTFIDDIMISYNTLVLCYLYMIILGKNRSENQGWKNA